MVQGESSHLTSDGLCLLSSLVYFSHSSSLLLLIFPKKDIHVLFFRVPSLLLLILATLDNAQRHHHHCQNVEYLHCWFGSCWNSTDGMRYFVALYSFPMKGSRENEKIIEKVVSLIMHFKRSAWWKNLYSMDCQSRIIKIVNVKTRICCNWLSEVTNFLVLYDLKIFDISVASEKS